MIQNLNILSQTLRPRNSEQRPAVSVETISHAPREGQAEKSEGQKLFLRVVSALRAAGREGGLAGQGRDHGDAASKGESQKSESEKLAHGDLP